MIGSKIGDGLPLHLGPRIVYREIAGARSERIDTFHNESGPIRKDTLYNIDIQSSVANTTLYYCQEETYNAHHKVRDFICHQK